MSRGKSEQELLEEAKNVNGAVNISGIVASLYAVMLDLWALARERGHGTDWVNQHPVVILYLEQINYLAGFSEEAVDKAYRFVPKNTVEELTESNDDGSDTVLLGDG